ncbi:pyruvate kinase [Anoxybacteroides amylolyticum]|uniref:Pyruvate kinase n=1 Tax=Anoxybacteroides amylolyticum TaxID=294699 RepID=A0A167TNS7_9BACL|nr:pyruvate kinase [Anoxybacillus amylolyticus]ANB61644.1 pyruvate kinase [Anoxybacillus amylolyticus]
MAIDLICTIGPATNRRDMIQALMEHGMTVVRLNLSHGEQCNHQKVIETVRSLNKQLGKKVKILGDLQGPKIRLGDIQSGTVVLQKGQRFTLRTTDCIGTDKEARVDYEQMVKDVTVGAKILLNDGAVELVVKRIGEQEIETEVIIGGPIGSRKSVNLPGTKISLPALTKKDERDLEFLLREEVDMVACSFVREAVHLHEVHQFIASMNNTKKPMIIAKIETLEAVKNFQAIREAADGIMVARGDLGVELPLAWVPLLQKAMIYECNRFHTYVITATQMLQSMVEQEKPTRAEVTDIFQAVLDGTNAVMLSAESATGKHPIESVTVLQTISSFAEKLKSEAPFDFKDMLNLIEAYFFKS